MCKYLKGRSRDLFGLQLTQFSNHGFDFFSVTKRSSKR